MTLFSQESQPATSAVRETVAEAAEADVTTTASAPAQALFFVSETSSEAAEGEQPKPTLKGRVEAVLFLTGVPLSAEVIAERLSADLFDVEDALMALIDDYNSRNDTSALEIDDADGYILQVRSAYQAQVQQMVPMELSASMLRTLSAIAIKAPVKQTELIALRGSSAYEHISDLIERKLVSRRKQGRSFMLDVTPLFQSMFKLNGRRGELAHLLELDAVSRQMAKATQSQGLTPVSPPGFIDLTLDLAPDETTLEP
ncbi:MAG: SMC-Scp complex subunit ScpB [Vampirovibrionales bacterium]|nr:SMC-Scp complex subunit ScpB [Vampirovibrionales bacterium]